MMNKMLLSVALALAVGLFAPQSAHASGTKNWGFFCEAEPLTNFWEDVVGFNTLSGRGRVCASRYGTIGSLAVRGLTPGNAYTVWWVYFDKPQDCAGFPLTPDVAEVPAPEPVGYAGNCGLADFFTPDPSGEFLNPLAVYGRMDGVVAYNKRRTFFHGTIREFEPAPGSQVWMFIFGHGPANKDDKRQLARQLLTPEDPLSGVPHLGIEGRPFGYPAGVVVIDIPD